MGAITDLREGAEAIAAELPDVTVTYPSVFAQWARVMEKVQAVGKTGRNTSQNYSFRGIDAVVNAVGPALREFGVTVVPHEAVCHYRDVEVGKNRTLMREVTVRVTYRVYGPGGDWFDGEAWGESMDSGDKGTPKAFSVAYRTFLLQALTIPTDEPEPDASSYERASSAVAPSAPSEAALAAAETLDDLPAEVAEEITGRLQEKAGVRLLDALEDKGWREWLAGAVKHAAEKLKGGET